MSVEWFLKLKEIDSLTKMRTSQIKAKSDQEDRLSILKGTQDEKNLQTSKLRQDLIALRSEIAQIDKELKIATDQRQHLIDMGGDEKKVSDFSIQIENHENKGLLFMGEEEKIEQELNDIKNFLTGFEKTYLEIQNEVSESVTIINQEIVNLDLRLRLLMEELPQDFKNILQKTMNKNLANGPFTKIHQGSCYICRYKISRIDESEIDMQQALKTCPQCSRIFLPYGS